MVNSNSNNHGRNKLTVKQINAASLQPGRKIRKLADGAGLTLTLRLGAEELKRYWHLRYADPITGKEQTASLGTYPDVGLADARVKAGTIREDLRVNITPKDRQRQHKEELKEARKAEQHTFISVAEAWYTECLADGKTWTSEKYQRVIKESLIKHVYPHIGKATIRDISPSDVKSIIRRIARAGTWETAQRVLQRIGTIYRWAEDEELVDSIPTRPAQRWLKSNRPADTKECNLPFLAPKELPELAQALDAEEGNIDRQTWLAIQLQALTFVRPGELRHAEWTEIDWETRQWTIPAFKMKMKREHVVPLSRPALAVLRELAEINGNRRWVFPSPYRPSNPVSDNPFNLALRELKPDAQGKGAFAGRHSCHAFRHTASTYLNGYRKGEVLPYQGDPVELQLAHLDKNAVRRRYNKATYLELRKEMMEVWGQYWLQCRDTEGKVISLRGAASV